MKYFASLIALLPFSIACSSDLLPGSAAPKIVATTWVKGTPIRQFEKNQTYVIEFWATWCGPCIDSIPHISKLATKFKDVQFAGFSIWEDNGDQKVQAFVKHMGERMEYSVAYGGNKDGMAKLWMNPAKQTGIPMAFIVSDQKVMWIGHPFGLEKPLASILAGTFDLAASRKSFVARLESAERAKKIQKEIADCGALFNSGKREQAKEKLSKIESIPEATSSAKELRFLWLAIEDLPAWKVACESRILKSEDERNNLSSFANQHALLIPEQSIWLVEKTAIERDRPNWYPLLNAARVFAQLKQYDKALIYVGKSRQVILDFQKANPDVPKGNALEILQQLADKIAKDRGVGQSGIAAKK